MPPLTRKQHEIIDFLLHNQHNFAHPPSLDQLCVALGLKSRGSLHRIIQDLIEAGLIEAMDRKHRGVRLTEKAQQTRQAPMSTANSLRYVGVIAAGKPIEAIEDLAYMSVPDEIKTEKSCYVLKVKGDSMIEEGIFDGDWVVIEQRCHARNGEIVVALVDKSEATLKFIEQYPHETLLIPANSAMPAMRYQPSRVEIQGVLVGQMRSYRRPS
ncbi:transcriptional repressor LexA [Methylomonas sp. LL1]|uniref:transcriptional repressor LexA n=1 Tax=Methylomonas sp. LL1 TaxID=2785785 RepID=UPI0018C3F1B2|nr:transcriptional repressor LexA [Methylomonas sp. LL1]QPK64653.1 transcriptional repressor LexA [Methylomonas sp. LL1]